MSGAVVEIRDYWSAPLPVRPLQQASEVVLVDRQTWPYWDDEPVYAEGARDKYAVRAPEDPRFPFVVPGHRYMFKMSDPRYPWQFWMEVVAYRIGRLVGIPVPPVHVAVDEEDRPGALMEWFYPEQGVEFILGGDLLLRKDPDFDRKRGTLVGHNHCLESVCAVLEENAVQDWRRALFRMLAFDSLIGNPDRHQDNWGIWCAVSSAGESVQRGPYWLSPAFDNGTSLSHERLESRLTGLVDDEKWHLARAKGPRAQHHMRLRKSDEHGAGYWMLLESLLDQDASLSSLLVPFTRMQLHDLRVQLDELMALSVPVPLSDARCRLISKIVETRQTLLRELEATYADA